MRHVDVLDLGGRDHRDGAVRWNGVAIGWPCNNPQPSGDIRGSMVHREARGDVLLEHETEPELLAAARRRAGLGGGA